MTQQINQLEVFERMIEAMESKKTWRLWKADRIIRKALSQTEPERIMSDGIFRITSEEASFLKKLHL